MEMWQRARQTLRQTVGEKHYEAWIKPLRMVECKDNDVVLTAPSRFHRDWVKSNFIDVLRAALRGELDAAPNVSFRIDERQGELFDMPAAEAPAPTPKPRPRRRANAKRGNLNPRYTFSNFVVGSSNQFAHAAAQAVAKRPGEEYNPLFIYGTVGIGKTHLANAIGHAVIEREPGAKVVYLSSEAFVNDLIGSLRSDRMADFKSRFRKVDVLILDDVQFLAGRERTQEEFFHTFNSLHEERRQIVLTSDKFPKDIPDLEERLRNRFEWGLTADIQAPEIETRMAIILKKAEDDGVSISNEVAEFLAGRIMANVRELEGAMTRLVAAASIERHDITVEFARRVLKPILSDQPSGQRITIEDVQKAVAERLGVSLADLKSKRRTQHIAQARQVAMYIARSLAGASYPVIGEKFGGRDHSTVIHAQSVVKKRASRDESLREVIQSIERNLLQRSA